jgi:hypothetical protein
MTVKIASNCDVTMLTFGGAQTFKIDDTPYGRTMKFDRLVAKTQLWTVFASGLNSYIFPTSEIEVQEEAAVEEPWARQPRGGWTA